MTDGLFIAFEGGDGAGKSTQVALLREAFEGAGRTVTLTRQPGGTLLGQQIRDLVLHGDHVSPGPRRCSTPPTRPTTPSWCCVPPWQPATWLSRTATPTRRSPTKGRVETWAPPRSTS
ncbi:dTMP kinase [Nostocoides sp. HKS02]|uniref:dTMP kinase n=1 Tax=Nostocoides sp. HKS02 TaxID=1813880 RepID=UPI00351B0523